VHTENKKRTDGEQNERRREDDWSSSPEFDSVPGRGATAVLGGESLALAQALTWPAIAHARNVLSSLEPRRQPSMARPRIGFTTLANTSMDGHATRVLARFRHVPRRRATQGGTDSEPLVNLRPCASRARAPCADDVARGECTVPRRARAVEE